MKGPKRNHFKRVHENIVIIGDPSETDMPDRRPTWLLGDQSETDMPDWRPVGDETCLIRDPLETNMPHWRPNLGKICIYYGSPMRHVGLQ